MPRYAYWTIILDGGPTAFRARQRDDLLPTLRQLQSRHPDAIMKWFQYGRLWESPEAAQIYSRLRRTGALYQTRGPDWRPGGEHRDPRARFKKKPGRPKGPRPTHPKRHADRPAAADRRRRRGPHGGGKGRP